MTSRGMASVWCAVIALGITVSTTLALLGAGPSVVLSDIATAPVVVIGSSLMEHAVPPFGGKVSSLLGDGRAHARLAISSITEPQTVELLNLVLETEVQTVLIEANALAFDFASRKTTPDPTDIRPVAMMQSLLDLSTRARQPLRDLLNKRPLVSEAEKLDAPFAVQSKTLLQNYPLRLRFPSNPEALNATLAVAASKGVALILIAPPRSQLAADAMGPQATEKLWLHFQTVARDLNLPLFQPAAVWPNEYFIDLAHMNRRGRARFLQELAQWQQRRL
jgi:hypothetical protein